MDHPTGKCVVRRCYDPHPWHSLQFVPTQKLTTSLEYIHPEISGTNPTTLPPDHPTNQSQGLTITVGCLWPGGLGGEDHAFRVDAVAVERLVSAQAERALHALELPVLRAGGLDHKAGHVGVGVEQLGLQHLQLRQEGAVAARHCLSHQLPHRQRELAQRPRDL